MSAGKRSILHLTPFAAVGGCETNCLRVIKACAEFDHSVLVFSGPGPFSEEFAGAGASVAHLGTWEGSQSSFCGALRRWSEGRASPDGVIYWSTSRLPAVLGALGGWGKPWVVYLGNPVSGGVAGNLRRMVSELARRPGFPVTLAACSEHTAGSHRRSPYFRRFPTRVIYNSVEPDLDRPREHRELLPGSAPRIGMTARLDGIKDHLTLLRAIALVLRGRGDAVLELAGDGPLRGALGEEARRLGVEANVHFLGFRKVPPLLGEWDLYVHSTTDAEGMGTAVAEAMMAGLPCVVSDIAVMREVCGEAGAIYAPPRDPESLANVLLELIRDSGRRRALGGNARERARSMFGLVPTASAYARLLFGNAPQQQP